MIVLVGGHRCDRQSRLREYEEHFDGSARVVETDPPKVGQAAASEIVVMLSRCSCEVGVVADLLRPTRYPDPEASRLATAGHCLCLQRLHRGRTCPATTKNRSAPAVGKHGYIVG